MRGFSTYEVTQPFKHVVFWYHVANQERSISTATTPAWGVTTIKSHDQLNKRLSEVKWQIEIIKSRLSQLSPIVTKLVKVVTFCMKLPLLIPFNHMVLWFWYSPMRYVSLEHKWLSRHRLLVVNSIIVL